MAVEVQNGLWISSIDGLNSIDDMKITHIMSVINWEPQDDTDKTLTNYNHLHIDLEDTPSADLLSHLPTATDFITSALASQGKVLVHCNQGVSRSAAIILSYLMKSQNLQVADALALLKSKYPAAPNKGFIEQLELYHTMNYTLDQSCVAYKRFLLDQAGQEYELNGIVDDSRFNNIVDDGSHASGTLYRCRKCRTLVCTAHNVVETEQGAGQSAFSWKKRDKYSTGAGNTATNDSTTSEKTTSSSSQQQSTEEGSLFVEPLLWMKPMVEASIQGKLYCPKCQNRLGSFNWSGTQTSSGSWVTPAFQLHIGKLDAFDPANLPAVVAIRQPKVLSGSSTSAAAHSAVSPRQQTLEQNLGALSLINGQSSRSGAVNHSKNTATPPGDYYFTHLVLDCDGVLVNSEVASCESLYLSIKQVTGFEIPRNFPVDYTPVFGMDVTNCLRYYKEAYNKTEWTDVEALGEEVTAVKDVIYKELTKDGVPPFPGVRELVAQAKQLGMGVAVASSGAPEKIQHNLGTAGLIDVFDPYLVVSAKYVARGKPAPDVYLEALKRLGCEDASRAVVVEDAVNGLKAGRAAGCYCIAVETSLPKDITQPYADLVVGTIADVDLMALKPPAVAIIKVGTSSLLRTHRSSLNLLAFAGLAEAVVELRNLGYRVILVSSGAVGVGCQRLGLESKPTEISKKQALASIGQVHLMRTFEDLFSEVGLTVSQVLLTLDNMASRQQFLNARATFTELLNYGVIPIVNENDTVAVEQLRIGNNDSLAAQVSILVQAQWCFLLTDVDALYTSNPSTDPDAQPIRVVEDPASLQVNTSMSGNTGVQWGTGGMATKLTAAQHATAAGTKLVICLAEPENILKVLQGERIGTVFLPANVPVRGRKRWILNLPVKGVLTLDPGAVLAVRDHSSSLFPSGVVAVEGEFGHHDSVVLCDSQGIEFGRGLANYSSEDMQKIKGISSRNIENVLGYSGAETIIHRANICLLPRRGPKGGARHHDESESSSMHASAANSDNEGDELAGVGVSEDVDDDFNSLASEGAGLERGLTPALKATNSTFFRTLAAAETAASKLK